jgi:small ligand-binding sensory domain FIST
MTPQSKMDDAMHGADGLAWPPAVGSICPAHHSPQPHHQLLQCAVSHATHLPLLRRDEESLCVAAVIGCCCSATVGRRAACAWHGCVTLSAACGPNVRTCVSRQDHSNNVVRFVVIDPTACRTHTSLPPPTSPSTGRTDACHRLGIDWR